MTGSLVLLITLFQLLVLLQAPGGEQPVPTVGPRDLVVDGDPVRIILPPDRIPAVTEPEYLSADVADAVHADDEPVLGFARDGQARAWSLWLLDRHEIVNDVVAGRAIAATW